MAKSRNDEKPGATTLAPVTEITTITGATLTELAPEDAAAIAASLVPQRTTSHVERLKAIQQRLETPFLQATVAAANHAVVTLLGVAPGRIQKLNAPEGVMVDQWLYLAALQNDIFDEFRGKQIDFARGDLVIIAQQRTGIRDMWAEVVSEAARDGEKIPNVLLQLQPNKNAALNPFVKFVLLDQPERLVSA